MVYRRIWLAAPMSLYFAGDIGLTLAGQSPESRALGSSSQSPWFGR